MVFSNILVVPNISCGDIYWGVCVWFSSKIIVWDEVSPLTVCPIKLPCLRGYEQCRVQYSTIIVSVIVPIFVFFFLRNLPHGFRGYTICDGGCFPVFLTNIGDVSSNTTFKTTYLIERLYVYFWNVVNRHFMVT